MEGEISNFIKVWLTVFVSLSYCYTVGKITPKGFTRFLAILPIVCLFLVLPLYLNTIHLGGTTAFFIAWLANFKLLLFVFGKGPLSSDPFISLGRFIAVGCLPIKIQQNPPPNSEEKRLSNGNGNPSLNGGNKGDPSPKTTKKASKSPLNSMAKCLVLALLARAYTYSEYLNPTVLSILYALHIYICLEFILALVAALARTLLGFELEPQFDEPYLSTSLQDFWGRRWNIMVSSILRPTVYEPVLHVSTRIMGRKWAPVPAVLGTFVVSALMHELIFFYLGRVRPTGEVSWFFILHGGCLTVEIILKKLFNGRFRLPTLVSRPLAVGFVLLTGLWMFIPQLLRCNGDVRAFEEYAAMGAFVKDLGRSLSFSSSNVTST
ncbi:hypothetical protein L1049_010367 [Liquidambar formosana]|uniref:Wax synthase domain-containing protein n=1 Tax=Liquidambar formosana TaxID=63359 RepID=A0AAP0R495_LIQFO